MGLIEHVKQSVENSANHVSKLDDIVLSLEGMSNRKVRHLLNNLVSMENCNYLEIGCWKGSTIISALYKNNPNKYWCIDKYDGSWGGTSEVKTQFIETFTKVLGYSPNLINKDFMGVNPAEYEIKDINAYFYDGDHLDTPTREALSKMLPAMQKEFAYVVDDWNGWNVDAVTRGIIKTLGLSVLYEKILPGNVLGNNDNWWNGLGVFVLAKKE